MSNHHESFTAEAARAFFAQVNAAKGNYKPEILSVACEIVFPDQGRPSAMTPHWRTHVLTMINREIGHKREQVERFDAVYRVLKSAMVKTVAAREKGYREGYRAGVGMLAAMMQQAAHDLTRVDEEAA